MYGSPSRLALTSFKDSVKHEESELAGPATDGSNQVRLVIWQRLQSVIDGPQNACPVAGRKTFKDTQRGDYGFGRDRLLKQLVKEAIESTPGAVSPWKISNWHFPGSDRMRPECGAHIRLLPG